jgi:hypothetical protein
LFALEKKREIGFKGVGVFDVMLNLMKISFNLRAMLEFSKKSLSKAGFSLCKVCPQDVFNIRFSFTLLLCRNKVFDIFGRKTHKKFKILSVKCSRQVKRFHCPFLNRNLQGIEGIN